MIYDQALQLLSNGGSLSTGEIVAHIPELVGMPEGPDILRLLLRLDRRFVQHEGRWLLRAGVSDPSQIIRQAVQSYFQVHPKGELLKHLVPAVAARTGQPEGEIKRIILQTYRSVGDMVLNQPKERK